MKSKSKRKAQDPEIFLNRELSWLSFNSRVLEEAEDGATPLAERAKFMAIVTNNLDEFFMVRVASLQNAIAEGDAAPDATGLSPAQQLAMVKEGASQQLKRLHELSERDVLPGLDAIGIRIVDFGDLDPALRPGVIRFFKDEVQPVITPLGIDTARPFPMLPSLALNLAVLFEPDQAGEGPRLGVVPVPSVLPRLVRVPGADSTYVRLETVVLSQLSSLFPGQVVRDVAAFRVLRDAE
ncbi:MAG: RNA degradosome polyphosphate kinase, partial [Vicinamibacteria bacterium]|nr:RNA degradosome polyphosphate kinase [Vicinamibacteria bacterium]